MSVRIRALLGAASALALATTLTAPLSAQGTEEYVAGTAFASAPTWDSATQSYTYKCTFATWAHVQVNWSCKLKNGLHGAVYGSHGGSFSTGFYYTPLYYYRKAPGVYLCTVAYAVYNNGSDSDSRTACR